MYTLEFLPVARADISEIAGYINSVLANPNAAVELIQRMIQAAEDICAFPYACPVYYPLRPLTKEYRKLVVGKYVMFYWVEEAGKRVVVARVVYAKRDYEAFLY